MTKIKKCTSDKPWDREHSGGPYTIEHVDAYEFGEQRTGWPSGDMVVMRCPNCGVIWDKELPQ